MHDNSTKLHQLPFKLHLRPTHETPPILNVPHPEATPPPLIQRNVPSPPRRPKPTLGRVERTTYPSDGQNPLTFPIYPPGS